MLDGDVAALAEPSALAPAAASSASASASASGPLAQAQANRQEPQSRIAPAAAAAASALPTGPAAATALPTGPVGQALHTLPVASEKRKYELTELYQFYIGASQADKLKIGDADAARWLAPSAPFPIIDPETKIEYPSLEHYMAGMKYKIGTNKPDLSSKIFSVGGTIHEESLRIRAEESAQGARALTAERDYELQKDERKKVIDESSTLSMKKYRATFDEGAWFARKDAILTDGLRQRWERDARLRKIVEAVKQKGMILLYYTGPAAGSNLGGTRRPDKTIDGENKVGRILMELAGFR